MRRARRTLAAFFAVGAAGAVAACLQPVDSGAASGGGAGGSGDLADASTWQLCGSPSCDDPGGTIPFLEQTPLVYLPDGATTADPCDDVKGRALAIRQTYCASCHGSGAGAGQGGFNTVLDVNALETNLTTSATFPRFLVPGSPATSYLYVRVANGTMPPAPVLGGPQNPTPSPADVSELYGWIQACAPGADAGDAYGGGDYGPGAAGDDAGAPAAAAEAGTEDGGTLQDAGPG